MPKKWDKLKGTQQKVVAVNNPNIAPRLPKEKRANKRVDGAFLPPRLQLAIDICYLMSGNEYATVETIAKVLNGDLEEVTWIVSKLEKAGIFYKEKGTVNYRKCMATNAAGLYLILYKDVMQRHRSVINDAVATRILYTLRGVIL